MMDPPATIRQVNSDIKEYDKKLVRSSNIPLDYSVDKKVGTPDKLLAIFLDV